MFNNGKRRKAFSMAEMLVVMLILAIVIIAATPVAVRRVQKAAVRPDHGTFECYWEGDQLYQVERNAQGESLYIGDRINRTDLGYCDFTPKSGAMFFTINAVGGGSPGAGTSTVFEQLPHSSGRHAGTDYTTQFFKYNSLLLSPYNQNHEKFSFEGQDVYDEPGNPETPLKWLKNMKGPNGENVVLRVLMYLRSAPGSLTGASEGPCHGGAAYMVKTKSSGTGCANGSWPNWKDFSYDSGKKKMVSKQVDNGGNPCFEATVFTGMNPGNGKGLYARFRLLEDEPFMSSGTDNPEPYFVAGNGGCRVRKGADGYFSNIQSACPTPADGTYENFGGKNCSIGSNVAENTKALKIEPLEFTPEGYNANDAIQAPVIKYADECYYNSAAGEFQFPNGDSCSLKPEDWLKSKKLDDYNPWYLHGFGPFALASKAETNGINFYAQSGFPGEFRTLFVSRFRGRTIRMRPGSFVHADDATAREGNSTSVLSLEKDAAGNDVWVNLLTVRGGQRAVEADGESFIMGSMFRLNRSSHVVAYDFPNNTPDRSGGDFGSYFMEKPSAFVYPVPNAVNPIPETVGQGGHGAYTIYRLDGPDSFYDMKIPNYTGGVITVRSRNSVQNRIGEEYTCRTLRASTAHARLNGYDEVTGDKHRCFAGDGMGGAVVISW